MPTFTQLFPASYLSIYPMVTCRHPHKHLSDCPRHQGWDSQGHGTGEQAMRLPGFPSFNRLGRLKVLTWSYLLFVVSGTCAAFALNFSAYCVCQFLSGTAVSGASSSRLWFWVSRNPEGSAYGDSSITGVQWTRQPDRCKPQLLPWIPVPAHSDLSGSFLE